MNGAGETVSDAWVTSKVKSSLVFNRNLDGLEIEVDTVDGKVSLAGVVNSPEEKALAEETAGNIRGVKGVDASELRVVK